MPCCATVTAAQAGADDTHGQIDAGHEAMDVVEPRRGVRLSEDHLHAPAEDGDGDGGEGEEADPNDELCPSVKPA